MKRINLRTYYPEYYREDHWVDVSDAVVEVFEQERRAELARRRKIFRYKAHYSLDRNDGLENGAKCHAETPYEIMERELHICQLHAAQSKLKPKQMKRIYMKYYLGMTVTEIAVVEQVSVEAVRRSIDRGLEQLRKSIKKNSALLIKKI